MYDYGSHNNVTTETSTISIQEQNEKKKKNPLERLHG